MIFSVDPAVPSVIRLADVLMYVQTARCRQVGASMLYCCKASSTRTARLVSISWMLSLRPNGDVLTPVVSCTMNGMMMMAAMAMTTAMMMLPVLKPSKLVVVVP